MTTQTIIRQAQLGIFNEGTTRAQRQRLREAAKAVNVTSTITQIENSSKQKFVEASDAILDRAEQALKRVLLNKKVRIDDGRPTTVVTGVVQSVTADWVARVYDDRDTLEFVLGLKNSSKTLFYGKVKNGIQYIKVWGDTHKIEVLSE